jgi:hypothetical protein
MPFLTRGKTNWKYILIVVVLAAIVGGGILGYLRYFEREIVSINQFPEIKKPEKVVEREKPVENKFSEVNERFVKVLFPNGGEQLVAGNTYWITWEAKNVEKIDILLVERKGEDRTYVNERIIAEGLLPTGENKYKWNIPIDLPPSKYILLISGDNGLVEDFSDDYFVVSDSLSIQEKEKMLREMLRGEFTIEGNEIVSSVLEPYLHLYLDKVIEGSFTNPYAKEYLFIIQLVGVPHAGGVAHSFLGVFDENKNLVTPSINIDTIGDFSSEAHFGGDYVNFNFYSCKGTTYILESVGECPNGGVCSDGEISLIKVEDRKFKVVQDVFKMILEMKKYENDLPWPEFQIKAEKDKMLIYDWKLVDVNFKCIAPDCIGEGEFGTYPRDGKIMRLIFSGELLWDNESCKFIKK